MRQYHDIIHGLTQCLQDEISSPSPRKKAKNVADKLEMRMKQKAIDEYSDEESVIEVRETEVKDQPLEESLFDEESIELEIETIEQHLDDPKPEMEVVPAPITAAPALTKLTMDPPIVTAPSMKPPPPK